MLINFFGKKMLKQVDKNPTYYNFSCFFQLLG